ncbi:MAG: hypothetical protein WAN31_10480 [Methylovirgula sp.]|jgi:hypothetical protein
MHRSAWPLAALTLALCGCNQDAPVASAPPPPAPQAATEFSNLPPGAACTDKINRYEFVLSTDHQTGNVNESVFVAIEQELTEAAAACAAGHDREALNLVRASEDRHGYHI